MIEKYNFDFKDNSFTLIRYVAAISIMIGHYLTYAMDAFALSPSYSIVAGDEIILIALSKVLAAIRGVPMFFCLSAYLICASIERSKTASVYYKKRFLRIYPELWLSMIVSLISILILWGGKNWVITKMDSCTRCWSGVYTRGFRRLCHWQYKWCYVDNKCYYPILCSHLACI